MSESLEQRVLRERSGGGQGAIAPLASEENPPAPDRGSIDGKRLAALNSLYPKGREHQSLYYNR